MTRTLIGTLCLRKDSGICLLAPMPSVVVLELGCVALSWLVGVGTGLGIPLGPLQQDLLDDGSHGPH